MIKELLFYSFHPLFLLLLPKVDRINLIILSHDCSYISIQQYSFPQINTLSSSYQYGCSGVNMAQGIHNQFNKICRIIDAQNCENQYRALVCHFSYSKCYTILTASWDGIYFCIVWTFPITLLSKIVLLAQILKRKNIFIIFIMCRHFSKCFI